MITSKVAALATSGQKLLWALIAHFAYTTKSTMALLALRSCCSMKAWRAACAQDSSLRKLKGDFMGKPTEGRLPSRTGKVGSSATRGVGTQRSSCRALRANTAARVAVARAMGSSSWTLWSRVAWARASGWNFPMLPKRPRPLALSKLLALPTQVPLSSAKCTDRRAVLGARLASSTGKKLKPEQVVLRGLKGDWGDFGVFGVFGVMGVRTALGDGA